MSTAFNPELAALREQVEEHARELADAWDGKSTQ